MPDSITSATHPVGIVISPGSTRTTATRFWAFLWSVEREPDQQPWHRRVTGERGPGWQPEP
ncbi:MAG: hypothetical protein SFV24_20825 [Gemmatimonadales bacterium]|nr:hypothetical protein [Gemmatimonadota bacterium]MDX2060265.1 hypothetical protein [Gemmatimonadales bacterium]